MTTPSETTLSLLQLQQTVQRMVTNHATQNVWVTAELSDVAERGGHCYMELIQKDDDGITTVAKARATIWANNWPRIRTQFMQSTGQRFATGLKVMVRVSVSYHPVYGMNMVISAVNPDYTMGDMLRRRREILMRLHNEGILEMNRSLEFPCPTLRIAVISAPEAAGYGDFMHQLYGNGYNLRFNTKLYPAIMQGEKAASSVIAALDRIASDGDSWDCVVIIRGGGSTSDLSSFENYELASNVAQFPLPIIVGIGHERDITVLDYVACQRVKTPTAAAEFLLNLACEELDRLRTLTSDILRVANECISGAREQLAYFGGQLPVAPVGTIHRAERRLNAATLSLATICPRRIQPLHARIELYGNAITTAGTAAIDRHRSRLETIKQVLDAISPEATLRRGYSITSCRGKIITDPASVHHGDEIVTQFASGTIQSTVR